MTVYVHSVFHSLAIAHCEWGTLLDAGGQRPTVPQPVATLTDSVPTGGSRAVKGDPGILKGHAYQHREGSKQR